MNVYTLHECLQQFPGAVLEVTAEGTIRASNGHLDNIVGRDLQGVSMEEVLDRSSLPKLRRILAGEEELEQRTWELNVNTPSSVELLRFLAVRAEGQEVLIWFLEYAPDRALERLYTEMAGLNRELVDAHRSLTRERRDLARALKEAEQARRLREEVLAIVSHDLRNPLAAMVATAAVLRARPDRDLARELGRIERAGTEMERLIEDLLDASAAESGNLKLERVPITIGSLVESTCREQRPHAARRGQMLSTAVPDHASRVFGDPKRLRQLLVNLIDNAMKFSPEGDEIRVEARFDTAQVTVSVHDAGPGVDAADRPHIFDRFWHTSRNQKGGSGLGLAIAKGVAEAHGGEIWYEEAPAGGAIFSFRLPLDRSPSAP